MAVLVLVFAGYMAVLGWVWQNGRQGWSVVESVVYWILAMYLSFLGAYTNAGFLMTPATSPAPSLTVVYGLLIPAVGFLAIAGVSRLCAARWRPWAGMGVIGCVVVALYLVGRAMFAVGGSLPPAC